jgi:hypothetical protein
VTGQERLASTVRDAVLGVPGVVRLSRGGPVEVATLFPNGKVSGVRLGDRIEVHVAVDQLPIPPLAERIRSAVRAATLAVGAGPRPVEVFVDDVDLAATRDAVPES